MLELAPSRMATSSIKTVFDLSRCTITNFFSLARKTKMATSLISVAIVLGNLSHEQYVFMAKLADKLSVVRRWSSSCHAFEETLHHIHDGAWKRFHKQLDHFPMVVCNKVREGDKTIIRLKEGNLAGCHVVIVDDLVQSGGTLIECQGLWVRLKGRA